MNKLLSLIILAVLLPSAVKAVNVTDGGVQKNIEMAQLRSLRKDVRALEQNPNLQQHQEVREQIRTLMDQLELLSTVANNRGHTKVHGACERYLSQLHKKLNGDYSDRANAACRSLF